MYHTVSFYDYGSKLSVLIWHKWKLKCFIIILGVIMKNLLLSMVKLHGLCSSNVAMKISGIYLKVKHIIFCYLSINKIK